MSGIQSLLSIGAIWLFALVSINFNTSVVHNISIEVENKVYLTAFSLADDMIEEIKQKAFDKYTVGVENLAVVSAFSLEPIGSLGQESDGLYNDIDDYNNYSKEIPTEYFGKFTVTVTVSYADSSNLDVDLGSQSFYKRVVVTVDSKNNYLTSPVKLSFIFSLHSKLK